MSRLAHRRGLRVAAAAVVALAGLALAVPRWEPGWRYDVHGVDVSHHQGPIDWMALAADDTAFAYIKATEGGDWVDPLFAENWRAAGDTAVLRGAYHFFTLCTPGREQAANMIATVPRAEVMLPPAVDIEFGGNCSHRPTRAAFDAELAVFLSEIEAHYRMTPIIYTTQEFHDRYLEGRDLDVVWWIRSLVREPTVLPGWAIWQYLPGERSGVDGRVDRNAFRGSRAEPMR